MGEIKLLVLIGIFILLISGVMAFFPNHFDWFNKDVKLTPPDPPESIYDLNGDRILDGKDIEIAYSCLNKASFGEECSILDKDQNGEISLSEVLIMVEAITVSNNVDYECSDDQVILKLSSRTNAHGSIWNDPNYKIDICYNEIFGVNYKDTSANIRSCKIRENNFVLALSDVENAHSARDGQAGYQTSVCYGDLVCNAKSSACDESLGEKLIVSLSDKYNAHLSTGCLNDEECLDGLESTRDFCNQNNVCQHISTGNNCTTDKECLDGLESTIDTCNSNNVCEHITTSLNAYPVNICCTSAFNTIIPDEPEIPTEDCKVGERLCIVNGVSICSTPDECNEEVVCNNNNICEQGESCSCSDCYGYVDSCSENLICDFRTETCQTCPEGNLNSDKNTCSNDPAPLIEILEPAPTSKVKDFRRYKINTPITFDQDITNRDLLLKDVDVEWEFSGIKENINKCLTGGNCDTTRPYSSHGYKVVTASVIERSPDKRKNSDLTKFLVYRNGLNLFAIIKKPIAGTIIQSGIPIEFDASDSFVAECFSDKIVCESKDNAGSLLPAISCYSVEAMWCYDYPKPSDVARYEEFGEYDFTFQWTFDKDHPGIESEVYEGQWTKNNEDFVKFEKSFSGDPGANHTAQLIVSYKYGING